MISDYPLITVVVPVYKVECYLEKCVTSIVGQIYSNLEIILVDDGSPDACPGMCDSWSKRDSRIQVIHKINGGLSSARNAGIRRAHGKYITFIDSDDYIDSDYIDYLFSLISKYGTDMSICQHKVIMQHRKFIDKGKKKGDEILDQKNCLKRLLYYDVIDTSAYAKLYKIDLFRDILYPDGKIFEDLATTYKIMMKCDYIACGYESKYNYFVRKDSISTSPFRGEMLSYTEITDEMAENIIIKYPELDSAALARKVRSRFSVINLMINSNEKQYVRQKNKCRKYIITNGMNILKDKNVKKNEKVAILLITLGYSIYEFFWKIYRRGAV